MYYYVIEMWYDEFGPESNDDDRERYCDSGTIGIYKVPAVGKQVIKKGWKFYTHGEFDTLEDAQEAIAEEYGECRRIDLLDNENDVVELYKPGLYRRMSAQASYGFVDEKFIQENITTDTTNEEIAKLVEVCESEANSQGCTLHEDLNVYFMERREDLIAEREGW